MDPLWPGEPAYGYARNGPVTLTDRFGLLACALVTPSSPCDDIRPVSFGGCVAMLCSLKSAADIAKLIKKFALLIGAELKDKILGLIKNFENIAAMPNPGECCKAARAFRGGASQIRSFGDLVALICGYFRTGTPWGDCKQRSVDFRSCNECCDQYFPVPVGGHPDSNRIVETRSTRCKQDCIGLPSGIV